MSQLQRADVEFDSEGNILRGWLFLPQGDGPFPGVVVTAGFAGVREGFLGHPYQDVFAEAGIATLIYDHANCGDSDGFPRQELDPIRQQHGYLDAITFLVNHPDIDTGRIGIWGTSYSGGHVLGVAASDRRIKAVVSQAMTISGHHNLELRHTPVAYRDLRRRWEADRAARGRGEEPTVVPAFTPDSASVEFANSRPEEHRRNWRNEITLRSWEHYDRYEPAAFIQRISPTPLLMIVGIEDSMTPAPDALAAYERALEPKMLLLIPGEHYDVYLDQFEATSIAARDWFVRYL